MNKLREQSQLLINATKNIYQRPLLSQIEWSWRLNAITGARGTGKTTLLLQKAKELQTRKQSVLYMTLDDIYFTENKVSRFTYLFIN